MGVFDVRPWHFVNCPILLKCWELGMNLSLESHNLSYYNEKNYFMKKRG